MRDGEAPPLSHVDEAGEVRMVDVGGKPLSRRRARASALVRMRPETAARLRDLPKGDALSTAKLAGIMAAKRTADLIPLCHPLLLSHISVELEVEDTGVAIVASAETVAAKKPRFPASEPRKVNLKGIEVPVEVVSIDWR